MILVVSLLILLVLTVIGVTAMSATGLEEKMSGNLRDRNLAFQASESALRGAEAWLSPLTAEPQAVASCSSAPCNVWQANVLPDLASQAADWWSVNAREYGAVGTQDIRGVTADPRYTIEFLTFLQDSLDVGHTPPTGTSYYRITSRATGGTDSSVVVLQSSFAKRLN